MNKNLHGSHRTQESQQYTPGPSQPTSVKVSSSYLGPGTLSSMADTSSARQCALCSRCQGQETIRALSEQVCSQGRGLTSFLSLSHPLACTVSMEGTEHNTPRCVPVVQGYSEVNACEKRRCQRGIWLSFSFPRGRR